MAPGSPSPHSDAAASLAKVLRCLRIQAQLGRICSLASLPAWPADDKGLVGTEERGKRTAERGEEDEDGPQRGKIIITIAKESV